MRIHAVVAFGLLMLPVAAEAQRQPRIGRAGVTRPAPLPPQAPAISRELAYKRLPVSFESYPTLSFVQAPGFIANGVMSSWRSFGAGTRADYRVMRFVSATLDMTSSIFGGPMLTQTVELGTRLRPDRADHRFYPFVDLRYGYMYATRNGDGTINDYPVAGGELFSSGAQYSQGFGAVAGAGMEVALTRSFSLTAAGALMRTRMRAYGYSGITPTDDSYTMRTVRYALGVRYNPVRLITASEAARSR